VDAVRDALEDIDIGIVVVFAALKVSIHLVDSYT